MSGMRCTPILVLLLLLAMAGCGTDDQPTSADEQSETAGDNQQVVLAAPTIVSASGTAVAQDEPLPVGPPGDGNFILVLPADDAATPDAPTEPVRVTVDDPEEIDLGENELPLGPPGSVSTDSSSEPEPIDDSLPTGPPGNDAGPDLVIDFGDDLPTDEDDDETINDGGTEVPADAPPVGLARVIAEAKGEL